MTITLYGLKNCDSCRKATKALDAAGRAYAFVDIRAETPAPAEIERWIAAVGADAILNRRSTTWKGLTEDEKAAAGAPDTLPALLVANPTLIKRPVVLVDDAVHVGWTAKAQSAAL